MTSGGSAFQLISPQLKSPSITIFGYFFLFYHTLYALTVKGDRYTMQGRMEACKRHIKISSWIESCALTPIVTHHLGRQTDPLSHRME